MNALRTLETKIPPPVVTAVFAGAMWLVARVSPWLGYEFPYRRLLAAGLALLGLALELVAAVTFRHACTTVNPMRPADATALVDGGVYHFSRNPIYLGDLLLLVAWSVYLGDATTLVGLPLFIAYLDVFQIRPEERVLRAKFGTAFDGYRRRVRRWL